MTDDRLTWRGICRCPDSCQYPCGNRTGLTDTQPDRVCHEHGCVDARGIDPDNPPGWYPERSVMGSTPYRNLGGCWFCGDKIQQLNGMCDDCYRTLPWEESDRRVYNEGLGILLKSIHNTTPDWWRQYAGGPDACIGCRATDNLGSFEHKESCPVVAALELLP